MQVALQTAQRREVATLCAGEGTKQPGWVAAGRRMKTAAVAQAAGVLTVICCSAVATTAHCRCLFCSAALRIS